MSTSRGVVAATLAALVAALALAVPAGASTTTPTEDAEEQPLTPPPVVLGLAPGEPVTAPPNIGGWPAIGPVTAASYVAIDRDSRTVLAARQADRLRSVASTVKMLTAVTARRLEPDLDRTLTAGPEVAGLEGSGVGLGEGESWTMLDLLEGMLVRSGNDAAEVVATRLLPGGRDAFLAEMEADARRLGLDGAVIVSPSGLDDRNQLSAAHLAEIAFALLADPVLAEIVAADGVALPGLGGVPNRNELVRQDDSVVGVKTGFTEAAGWSLVAAADREDRVTVAVVLAAADDERRFDEAATLLDHAAAFTSLPALTPVEVGCPGHEVRAVPGAVAIVVPDGSEDRVEVDWPPADCPDREQLVVTPTLQRLPLEPVVVDVESREVASVDDPDGELGRWLAASVQRAMRAVPPGDAVLRDGGAFAPTATPSPTTSAAEATGAGG